MRYLCYSQEFDDAFVISAIHHRSYARAEILRIFQTRLNGFRGYFASLSSAARKRALLVVTTYEATINNEH
jgi:hypothetical protein